MSQLKLCLLIFLAGGCGALARFGVSKLVSLFPGPALLSGTFVVNILGCLFFGFVWELACVRMLISDLTRVVICVGFMGSFTTFSSLIFDSFALVEIRPVLLVANILVQVVLGFAALLIGMALARLV